MSLSSRFEPSVCYPPNTGTGTKACGPGQSLTSPRHLLDSSDSLAVLIAYPWGAQFRALSLPGSYRSRIVPCRRIMGTGLRRRSHEYLGPSLSAVE
ncbi:hypothetical protein TWF132_009668 [Orbilia oligospora]|nr:hypothetical protein TWF132_009668 [Orbilia oligospora]